MHLKNSQFVCRYWLGVRWRGPSKGRLLLGGVVAGILLIWGQLIWGQCALAVPSTEALASDEVLSPEGDANYDIPEEILRTEIITGARSPLTGEVLSAAEYAQLQATLAAPAGDTLISDDLRYLIFLLQFRRAIRPIVPFL